MTPELQKLMLNRAYREYASYQENGGDDPLLLDLAQEVERLQREVERLGAAPGLWRCYHCDGVFTEPDAAEAHFGPTQGSEPLCQVAQETYRRMERELEAYRTESDATSRAFYALGSEHRAALRAEEQRGYDKGLADGRRDAEFEKSYPPPISNWWLIGVLAALVAFWGAVIALDYWNVI